MSDSKMVSMHPQGPRERFQKWVLSTEHPVYGWLDGHWLRRGDDREGYANEYVQGLWVAFKVFAAPAEDVRAVDEPVAWTHTLHMELDQNHSVVTLDEDHPFGVCGEDFDPSYTVTSEPLYRQPQPIPQAPLHPPQSTWPTWANWCGLSQDGYWWYYEVEPVLMQQGRATDGRYEKSDEGEASNAWAAMIYERVQS